MTVDTITTVTNDHLPNRDGLTVIDFTATWCGPCKAYAPVFAGASRQHRDVAFFKVDIDQNPALAARFGILGVPTTVAMRGGAQVGARTGAIPAAALNGFIDTHKPVGSAHHKV